MSIVNYFKNWKERQGARKRELISAHAEDLYQVRECHGKIWFVFNGSLVCPMEMINGDPIESLNKMRAMYVVRRQS